MVLGKFGVLEGLDDSPLPRRAMTMILWLRSAPWAWVSVLLMRPWKQVWTIAILVLCGLRIW